VAIRPGPVDAEPTQALREEGPPRVRHGDHVPEGLAHHAGTTEGAGLPPQRLPAPRSSARTAFGVPLQAQS
jgi:hypothetical protein